MGLWSCYRDVLPFAVMTIVECTTVGSTTIYKAAMLRGMSHFVFIVYSGALATLILLPSSFIFHRYESESVKTQEPILEKKIKFQQSMRIRKQTKDELCIFQASIVKEYPAEVIIVFFYTCFLTIQAAIVSLIAETDPSAWIVRADMELISIIYSGVFVCLLGTVIHTWSLRLKGPVYVAMFKPLSIVIAVVMGVMFLSDTLYLGSVVGAIIISLGFYAVMWGKAKEENMGEDCGVGSLESSTQKVSLLQSNGKEII
ncbi:hypothetical protein HHK36_007089 [Tetracentron sinense]|uniref:WAT1-related protein n=1 Tax=Tetracentron sinense TaxID=13715 RepID=A0A834ZIM9_TETSI|nr:hypothetical protein HHK36_007089 [Tetracentron sinense]